MKKIYLIDFNQIGGYKHSMFMISHLRKGIYKRDLYGDWAFLGGLSASNKDKSLMLDLHNVTDTLWNKEDSDQLKVQILKEFIESSIQKYNLEKLVVCSWVGNIERRMGQSVINLLNNTFELLDQEYKKKFIGMAIDTFGTKKKKFKVRDYESSKSGLNSINETTSPKPQICDSLNLGLLIDDSPNHLPDEFFKVKGYYFSLDRDYKEQRDRLKGRIIIDYFDKEKFINSQYNRSNALIKVLDSIYLN